MGFFGAVFAALTLFWDWHLDGAVLVAPFLVFAAIGVLALYVIRAPGTGIAPSPGAARTIMWSTVAEGVGLFLAANIVINLHRPALLLPAMALVVGLHFLPIARAAAFRPFYILGTALIVAAAVGFTAPAPAGGEIAGFGAAAALWIAAATALLRDATAKRLSA